MFFGLNILANFHFNSLYTQFKQALYLFMNLPTILMHILFTKYKYNQIEFI